MKLRNVDTPFIPAPEGAGNAPAEWQEGDERGVLQPIAASVLMKVMYGARMARWDLLKIIQLLATRITKWSKDCDKALHRLICYINSTKHYVLSGCIAEDEQNLELRLYVDADFAGDRPSYKSTSGVYLTLAGSDSCFPLSAKAARQTAVSHSTVEAEVAAADVAARSIGLPQLDLWSSLAKSSNLEDNESTYQIIKTGRNPTMRHISRTHGVNIQWPHDVYTKGDMNMIYTRTEAQCADIFIKNFRDVQKWHKAVQDIGVAPKGTPPSMPPEPGPRPPKEPKEGASSGGRASLTNP